LFFMATLYQRKSEASVFFKWVGGTPEGITIIISIHIYIYILID
jgi:hypothetical protein